MRDLRRHRYGLALPFIVLAVVAIVGGLLNGVTARGRLIDDFTDQAAKGGTVTHGVRAVAAGDDGSYEMTNVPRTSRLRVDAPGYLRTSAPGAGGDIRLSPLSLTVQVNEAGTEPVKGVATAQFRRGTVIVGTTNTSGNTVIAPHPGKDGKLLLCAKDYETREITVQGVAMTIELRKQEGNDCPPLPTPSPAPGASPSPSPSPSPR
ncbi:MAG TPA: hypothetical protein VFM93_04995 [Candidatus Limnocylindria bacterium]|nr:hypothetical protein [Candidatus Limnocylindria bacterium]